MGKEYWILSQDNIDSLMELTGKTEDELQKMYADAMNFGHVEVFWRHLDQWYNLRVSAEYVFYGMLERSVEKAMEITIDEYNSGIRRG